MAAASSRCRCCPYGFHIDLEFVSFAEDVSKGNSIKRTPTLPRRSKSGGGDRNLMSPMDSLFSDSMENIVSDFEEILAEKPRIEQKTTAQRLQNGYQNGYSSDYTAYRSRPGATHVPTTPTNGNRTFALDFNTTPPKPPPHRNGNNATPTTNNGRSTPTAYTALGRAVSELKARNGAESPFPDREVASRTGTPIDLGFTTNHQTNGHVRRESETRVEVERPYHLPAATASSTWRREKSFTPTSSGNVITARATTPTSSLGSDFASLRRSREKEHAMSDTETISRSRFFSASPRLPRKMELAPPLTPASNTSNFTYSHQNGNTILSRSQATCTSPVQKEEPKKETRSAATSTGPLPPAKPCSECPNLRKELKEMLERIPPPKQTLAIGTVTDPVEFKRQFEVNDANVGESVETMDAEMSTDEKIYVNRACSPIVIENSEIETQTDSVPMVNTEIQVGTQSMAFATQTDKEEDEPKKTVELREEGVNTDEIPSVEIPPKPETVEREIMTTRVYYKSMRSQTDEVEQEPVQIESSATATDIPSSSESASQTDNEMDSCEPRILDESEMGDSLWLMPSKETAEIGVETDAQEETVTVTMIPSECTKCLERENTFARNVGVGTCSINDKICISCDPSIDEVDENDAPGFQAEEKPRTLDQHRVAAVKKLLTTEQKQNFVRGTAISRSARIERKKGDTLEYIEQKNKTKNDTAPSSTPTENTSEALREKVVLKKETPPPPSSVPDPIPAKIPRPKISKYVAPHQSAETPDEADEAADRLTPLRSELRTLNRWPRSNSNPVAFSSKVEESYSDEESDGSEGSYETNEDGSIQEGSPFEITVPLREALESLNSHLLMPGTISSETVDWALKYIQHEWTRVAARKASKPENVALFIDQCKELSEPLLKTVVNITDQNGNTALHYAVSHGNFYIVSCLLDSNDCTLNLSNRAGYTAVMLAALSSLEDEMEKDVVQRLFEMGDVNARASQHGQTALMLAVSHGKKAASQLLLECGADVNIQDEEGSTALMCAAEHGHKDLVKLLLSQPSVDAALTDCDNSTALSIAVENGHRDIGVLIYAHLNYVRSESLEESTI